MENHNDERDPLTPDLFTGKSDVRMLFERLTETGDTVVCHNFNEEQLNRQHDSFYRFFSKVYGEPL